MPPKKGHTAKRAPTLLEAFNRHRVEVCCERPKKVVFDLSKMAGRTIVGAVETLAEQGAWVRAYAIRRDSGKHWAFEQPCRLLWKTSKPYPLGTPVSFQIDFEEKGLKDVARCGCRVIDAKSAKSGTNALELKFAAEAGLRVYLAFPWAGRLLGPYILESVACGVSKFAPIDVRPSDLPLAQFLSSAESLICDGFACLFGNLERGSSSTKKTVKRIDRSQAHPLAEPLSQPASAPQQFKTIATLCINREMFWAIAKEGQIAHLLGDSSAGKMGQLSAQELLGAILDKTEGEILAMYRGGVAKQKAGSIPHDIPTGAEVDRQDTTRRIQDRTEAREFAEKLAFALWTVRSGCDEKEMIRRLNEFKLELDAVQLGLRGTLEELEGQNFAQPVWTSILPGPPTVATEASGAGKNASVRIARTEERVEPDATWRGYSFELLHALTLSSKWTLVPSLELAYEYQHWVGGGCHLVVIHSEYAWLHYRDVWEAGLNAAWQRAQSNAGELVLVCLDAINRTIIPLWGRPYFLLSAGVIEALPEGHSWPSNLRILATFEKAPHSFPVDLDALSNFAALPLKADCLEIGARGALPSECICNVPKTIAGSKKQRRTNLAQVLLSLLPPNADELVEEYCESLLEEWPRRYAADYL